MKVELTKEEIGLLISHLWLNPCEAGCMNEEKYGNRYSKDCNCPMSKMKEKLLIKLTEISEKEKERGKNEKN